MGLKRQIEQFYDNLLHLVYPEQCICCELELSSSEKHLCTICKNELHHTDYEKYTDDTALDKLFWGRVQVEAIFSLLYYKKNEQSRRILHRLKYNNRPDLAKHMGELIGERIQKTPPFDKADLLIPIPIHEKKRYIRGYNQSEEIAKGIHAKTEIPIHNSFLIRSVHTESQTKKGKFERWENVQGSFALSGELPASVKHVIIVDDVITTGSTLETIIRLIKENYKIDVSVISIAYAGG